MLKPLMFAAVVVAAAVVLSGCDKPTNATSAAASAGNKLRDQGDKLRDQGEAALARARAEVTNQFDVAKITESITKLTGPAKETASAKLVDFQKMLEEFKTAPMEKINEWKEKLVKAFNELKTAAGL